MKALAERGGGDWAPKGCEMFLDFSYMLWECFHEMMDSVLIRVAVKQSVSPSLVRKGKGRWR